MNQCSRCKLSLPNNYLTPCVMQNQTGQRKKGFLCENCKKVIDAQQKGKTNGIT